MGRLQESRNAFARALEAHGRVRGLLVLRKSKNQLYYPGNADKILADSLALARATRIDWLRRAVRVLAIGR